MKPEKAAAEFPADAQVDIHVGAQLRRIRALRGLALTDLSCAAGVAAQQIQKYETGYTRMRPARLIRLARALRVPVDDFFLGLPGAENVGDDSLRALRALRGYVARWGLDHPDPQARREAVAALQIGQDPDAPSRPDRT